LSESLKAELTAINQYFLHAKMCENWGYLGLGAFYRKESIEEMVHAEKLMNRILFLDGTPNMTDIGPIKLGTNVKAQFESDLDLEMHAVKTPETMFPDSGSRETTLARGVVGAGLGGPRNLQSK
jgi:bacterioferritin